MPPPPNLLNLWYGVVSLVNTLEVTFPGKGVGGGGIKALSP